MKKRISQKKNIRRKKEREIENNAKKKETSISQREKVTKRIVSIALLHNRNNNN